EIDAGVTPRVDLRSTAETFRVIGGRCVVARKPSIRIGNGCGFWGDNLDAPVLLAEHGGLDYLTLEYLAELTMSILVGQKQRDPQTGFATDFLDVLQRLTPALHAQP